MEAAAMGLPTVATDIRGNRQVIDDGVTGALVPVRDPSALARAIGALVDTAELRRSQGEAAASRAATNFDQQRQIEVTLAQYRALAR